MENKTGVVEIDNSYIKSLCDSAENHKVINHPYLTRLANGFFPDIQGAIKDLVFQYYAYSENFIRYLTATISLLDNNNHRKALLDNLFEEAGHISEDDTRQLLEHNINPEWVDGIAHPVLFRRFLDRVGINEEFRNTHEYSEEAIIWRDMFLNLCSRYGAAQALGAMGLGTESIVKHIYKPILVAIDRFMPEVSPKDRVFFDLHALLDDEHGDILVDITNEYICSDKANRIRVKEGMLMALDLRHAFFDAMLERAEAMIPVEFNGRKKEIA